MTDDYTCPDCGSRMVRRTNRQTGEYFWGCVLYPECTGTRHDDDRNAMDASENMDAMPSDRYRRADKDRWR